jgi:hypothetical protein
MAGHTAALRLSTHTAAANSFGDRGGTRLLRRLIQQNANPDSGVTARSGFARAPQSGR